MAARWIIVTDDGEPLTVQPEQHPSYYAARLHADALRDEGKQAQIIRVGNFESPNRRGNQAMKARTSGDGRTGCEAVQYSDQMQCARCGLAYDVNDPDPPECRVAPKSNVDIDAKGNKP